MSYIVHRKTVKVKKRERVRSINNIYLTLACTNSAGELARCQRVELLAVRKKL